jgi:hypothetical protein
MARFWNGLIYGYLVKMYNFEIWMSFSSAPLLYSYRHLALLAVKSGSRAPRALPTGLF